MKKRLFHKKQANQKTDSEQLRFERKYRIPHMHYLALRHALVPYMAKDPNSGNNGYIVTSLYFDTYDYQSYDEKMDGNGLRLKLRMRTFGETSMEHTNVRVELKARQYERVSKRVAVISKSRYEMFMATHSFENVHENPVLESFEYRCRQASLSPKMLIRYRREAFLAKDRSDLRITFDHDVKSAHADDLFQPHAFYREHIPHQVIMEIKFHQKLPTWLAQLVHRYGLKMIANSKYTQAVSACRHDLSHPGSVVLIR